MLGKFAIQNIIIFAFCYWFFKVLQFRGDRCGLTHCWHKWWNIDFEWVLLRGRCYGSSAIWCCLKGRVPLENGASSLNGYHKVTFFPNLAFNNNRSCRCLRSYCLLLSDWGAKFVQEDKIENIWVARLLFVAIFADNRCPASVVTAERGCQDGKTCNGSRKTGVESQFSTNLSGSTRGNRNVGERSAILLNPNDTTGTLRPILVAHQPGVWDQGVFSQNWSFW